MHVTLVSALSDRQCEPLGLMTLAAVGRPHGIETRVLPLPARPEEAAFLEGLRGVPLLGLSTLCNTYPRTLRLAALAKELHPDLPVVLGGPQATVTARATLERFPFVDLIVKGEAEGTWVPLVRAALGERDWSAVPGAVYRGPDGIVENETLPFVRDLDSLPLPEYRSLAGFTPRGDTIEIGRGCPYGCAFCSTSRYFKRAFRLKSPERILVEVMELHRLFGTRHFDFIHDMFAARRASVVRLCELLRGQGFTWGCSARTDCLDEALIGLMAEAGCRGIYFGLETGAQAQQGRIGKKLNIADAVGLVRYCQGRGLAVTASFIVGFPDERPAELRDTLLCALELSSPHPRSGVRGIVTAQMHLYAPLAGTDLTEGTPAHDFDGNYSNIVRPEGEDGLLAGEHALAASDFELFSAFFYPRHTPVPRATYLAVTAAFESLAAVPGVRVLLASRLRLDFVDFLLGGGAGGLVPPEMAALPPQVLGPLVLARYALGRPWDRVLAGAMDRDFPGWAGRLTSSWFGPAVGLAGPAWPASGRNSPGPRFPARP